MVAQWDHAPLISLIIPARNAAEVLRRCLDAVCRSSYPRYECIVVDDGSSDATQAVAGEFPVRIVALTGGPFGPAYARNRGAEVARGDLLYFVDADVLIRPDTLATIADAFQHRPEIDAMFGSYDDGPDTPDFLSRYKNLFHHFVHQHTGNEAVTFWSGCGAVRSNAFFAIGGFNEERYRRPSIEDIELGYRLKASGHRIMLNRDVQVKHLKRWTMREMIRCDLVDRAIPWTQLILEARTLPNALNLQLSQRASAVLLCMVLLYLGLVAFFHSVLLLPMLAGLFLLVAGNWSEGRPHFQMSPRARGLTYALVAATGAVAWAAGLTRLLFPLALLVFGIGIDVWISRSSPVLRRLLFTGVVFALLAGFGLLLMSFPIWLTTPLLLLILSIVAVNYELYAFFARRQGPIFALAVLPFHLLYYVYSVAGLVVGTVAFLADRISAPGSPPTPPVKMFLRAAPRTVATPAEPGPARPTEVVSGGAD